MAILPVDRELVDRVDLVEVNSVYGDDGGLVFDQVIWWDWNPRESRFDVVDWRLLKGVREPVDPKRKHDVPPPVGEWRGGHATPTGQRGSFVSLWYDEKSNRWRRVEASIRRRTWTAFDVELIERQLLPCDKRRKLRR